MADEMKRDMDLWRKILRSVEARKDTGDLAWVALDGHTDDEISFHVKLLIGAGLLEGEDRGGDGDRHCYFARCLTNDGYNFLEAARDDTRWKKAKAEITEQGLPVTLDVMKGVLLKLVDKIIAGL